MDPETKDIWRKPTDPAPDGAVVWIIERHHKAIDPLSYTIHAGVVEYNNSDPTEWRVAQGDETGRGWCSWYPEGSATTLSSDMFQAWAFADEQPLLPDFLTQPTK
tara:strand:- start:637 stop:951 length:315 start_codon:yes stop_codon:yes gene_type:complete